MLTRRSLLFQSSAFNAEALSRREGIFARTAGSENVSIAYASSVGINPDATAKENSIAIRRLIEGLQNSQSTGPSGIRLIFGRGYYQFESIELSRPGDEIFNIHFEGEGGATGTPATRFQFAPISGWYGMRAVSIIASTFTGIEFVAANDKMKFLIEVTANRRPSFSSFMVKFEHCSFRSFAGVAVRDALIHVENTANILFDHCWWSGADDALLIGSNVDGFPDTFGHGVGADTVFRGCYISGDIRIRRSLNTSFYDTVWGRNSASLRPARILPEGDEAQVSTVFVNPISLSQNDSGDGTFWTQGSRGYGLSVLGGRFSSHLLTFNINGSGYAQIICVFDAAANSRGEFLANQTAIEVRNGAESVTWSGSRFEGLVARGFSPVKDQRKLPFFPYLVYDLISEEVEVDRHRSSDVILEKKVVFIGGPIRIRYHFVVQAKDKATFSAHVRVGNAPVYGSSAVASTGYPGDLAVLACDISVIQEGTPRGISVALVLKLLAGEGGRTISSQREFPGVFIVEAA